MLPNLAQKVIIHLGHFHYEIYHQGVFNKIAQSGHTGRRVRLRRVGWLRTRQSVNQKCCINLQRLDVGLLVFILYTWNTSVDVSRKRQSSIFRCRVPCLG